MDAASWRRLVEVYGPTIYGWCRRAGFQKADAADLSQEVFAAVARGLGRFRRDRDGDSFRQWIRTITLNKIRNAWQRRPPASQGLGGSSWQQRLGELAADESASSMSSAREIDLDEARQQALEQVRLEVNGRDWTIFERLVIDEQPPDAIAREFEISVNLVYVIRSRLLKRLRDLAGAAVATDGD